MLKKVTAGVIALAVAGLAGPAFAACTPSTWHPDDDNQIDGQTYCVDVNIEVHKIVSLWGFAPQVNLEMIGADGNNHAGYDGSFFYINNVPADVMVKVQQGTGAAFPDDMNFHIFKTLNSAQAKVALQGNAYTNADALTWTDNNLGLNQEFASNLAIDLDAGTKNYTYVANKPGNLLLPSQFNLVVTWTIAEAS